jgi:hypothetical protein
MRRHAPQDTDLHREESFKPRKLKATEFLATDPEARVPFPALPEKKVMDLERGPLSLVSTTEELLDRKVADPVYKARI